MSVPCLPGAEERKRLTAASYGAAQRAGAAGPRFLSYHTSTSLYESADNELGGSFFKDFFFKVLSGCFPRPVFISEGCEAVP